ncbi:MAG: peptidylprolyl isomerase [Ignavibacteriaceae bacterium]|nr:peptidylprolyl isomerase [Ignavibacteriaceae bacterium]
MKLKLILFLSFLSINVYSQQVLDKIVAVVDNEIILQSELDFQVNLFASQRQINPQTPGLKDQVLNSLIEEKLVYAQADIDSIMVTEEEIDQRINYQIEIFTQQYGSREKLEQVYGMSIEKIKRELRDDVRKNLMIQRLQEKKFEGFEASRREVEEFFSTYKDSLGQIPEKVTIAHIYINPKSTAKLKDKYFRFASALLDSLKNGADFEKLALKYSEDPGSKSKGGDLGYAKRGVFYPEFESTAFSLAVGQISEVVESPVGFHIIQLLDRKGESIHTRHILIKIKNDEEADLRAIELLSEIRDSIMKGLGTFEGFAKKYSEDEQSNNFGGELGTFYLNQLDKNLLDAISKLKQGDIGFPRRIEYGGGQYGYHIVFLKERIPQHTPDLNLDYDELKRLADEFKKQNKYKEWIRELKNKIFWEVRI